MIEHCPLQIETVKVLCKMANGSYPSQWLVRELTAVFERKPSVKKKIYANCRQRRNRLANRMGLNFFLLPAKNSSVGCGSKNKFYFQA